ncbi:MAG: hypothetical protein ABI877_12400 [Gemmatimonadaceae bacterium]
MSIRLATLVTGFAALLFGPPSIKVETVTNPADAAVKGAVFMIVARHHVSADSVEVTARAEGVIAGARVSRVLTLTPTARTGVFGVKRQWDEAQPWVLVFTVASKAHDKDGVAEAVVRLSAGGRVLGIDYPMGKLAGGYPWPRKVTAEEIDAALTTMGKASP